MLNGKIGGEKILSIWWFIILGVIGGGIVSGIFMYYGLEGDSRALHAQIIAERVFDCIEENNFIKSDWMNADEKSVKKLFEEKCFLRDSPEIYISVFIKGKTGDFLFGNPLMKEDCKLRLQKKSKLSKYFPECYEEERNLIYFDSGKRASYLVKVIVGIKSLGEKQLK